MMNDRADPAALTPEEPDLAPSSSAASVEARVAALRAEMKRRGLDGFLVPRADEHQGEYVPPSAERLAWISGFTGSAGLAAILADQAALFVDGRYTIQGRAEAPEPLYEIASLSDQPVGEWLAERAPEGARIGYDPKLHTPDFVAKTSALLARRAIALVPEEANPLDAVWTDRPPPPLSPVVPQPLEFAGETSAAKRERIAADLRRQGLAAAVLSAPDSIAWLLNVRGSDVPHTPLPLSFAVLHETGAVDWYVDPRKVPARTREWVDADVRPYAPEDFGEGLRALGTVPRPIRVDSATGSAWISQTLQAAGAKVDVGADPCTLPKAVKNAVEMEGIKAAHRRDGLALSRFLHWLSTILARRDVTEIEAADRLEAFRAEGEHFRGLSFPTIAGAGPNGAIVHYRASERTNRPIDRDCLFLLDSGAQYVDGTTDVTRTLAVGTPSDEMKRTYTLVLKGHIAVATARFPVGTSGAQLDTLARFPLWQAGLDYDHGTGHGVGAYLSVHEGPQGISKRPGAVALKPNMVISNEPGYYKAGAYGIRIENLVRVVEVPAPEGAERSLLGFESLTLAPIDTAPILPALLTHAEIAWLDAYHASVRATHAPFLEGEARAWLEAATAPLGS
jgi:Xaa-Pro aminopeptidase